MKRIICLATACMMLVATMVLSLSVSAADESFSAVKAVRISDLEIAVEFSEDLADEVAENVKSNTGVWASLRWYTMNEDGTPNALSGDTSGVRQNGNKTSVAFWTNSDGTQVKSVLVITFADKNNVDCFTSPADDNPYKAANCTPYISFEEKIVDKDGNNISTDETNDHTAVDTIKSASVKVLAANCCKSGAVWDAACVSLTTDYNWRPATATSAHTTSAPNTADSSVLMVSVAFAALICGAAVIGSKKKH